MGMNESAFHRRSVEPVHLREASSRNKVQGKSPLPSSFFPPLFCGPQHWFCQRGTTRSIVTFNSVAAGLVSASERDECRDEVQLPAVFLWQQEVKVNRNNFPSSGGGVEGTPPDQLRNWSSCGSLRINKHSTSTHLICEVILVSIFGKLVLLATI